VSALHIRRLQNYSFGFIDVTGRASDEFLEGVIAAQKRPLAVHSGKSAPFSQKAKAQQSLGG
jgi:hypothetical protein